MTAARLARVVETRGVMTDRDRDQSSTNETSQSAREVAQQGQQKASEAAEQGRQKAEGQIAVQKERAADQLEGVSRALRHTGGQLREQDQASFGNYVEQAAGQTDRLSRFLHEKEADQLVGEVEGFARNKPAVFLGGAFALGALAARFVKSSAGQRQYFDVSGRAQELGAAATKGDANAADSGSRSSSATPEYEGQSRDPGRREGERG